MRPVNTLSLRKFLYEKDARYVDALLWVLHNKNFITDLNSIGIKESIDNCLRAFERQFNDVNDNLSEIISECLDECEALQISQEYLDWLNPKDKRQCNFVWLTLESQGYLRETTMLSSNGSSNKYATIIKALDRSSQSNRNKLKLIIELRDEWKNQTSYKGFRYDWLSEKNALQCEKALKFLYKSPSDKSNSYAKPELIQDSPELCNYFNFLATIDCWSAPLADKIYFHKKAMDAARKWNTEKTKSKKNNSTVQVIDSKSISMLEEITNEIGAKNNRNTLKTLILEKHATLNTPQTQENVEPLELNNESAVSDSNISPQEYSEITAKLEVTEKALAQLEAKALSQLEQMCENLVRLEGSELLSRQLTEFQIRNIKETFEEKKNTLLSFKSML